MYYDYKSLIRRNSMSSSESCACGPGNLYRGGLPTWNPPPAGSSNDAICAYNLLGLNNNDPCYSDCFEFPIPCYGYALNIATPNNWTYPGLRHLAIEPNVNNCADLILQTTSDGSTYVGMIEPTVLNSDQHVFVGYAANGEYHFARKDTDTNTYSSKNGESLPSQRDSNNNLITDASKAVFNLFGVNLSFCGYFTANNQAGCPNGSDCVCPTDSDCVKGDLSGSNDPWSGCGSQ